MSPTFGFDPNRVDSSWVYVTLELVGHLGLCTQTEEMDWEPPNRGTE